MSTAHRAAPGASTSTLAEIVASLSEILDDRAAAWPGRRGGELRDYAGRVISPPDAIEMGSSQKVLDIIDRLRSEFGRCSQSGNRATPAAMRASREEARYGR